MTEATWTFRDHGLRPGAEQMAIDAALLEDVAAGRSGPVFRVYGWRPPAVSLGFHQDAERELDTGRARALGFDIVRRPTGGRMILHADELTYAVAARLDDRSLGGSVRESHAAISRILRDGLSRLGIAATLAGEEGVACAPGRPEPPVRRDGGAAPPCFATAIGAELLAGGRKILGSAQRRIGGAFLQHGSLLLGDGHLELASLIRVGGTGARDTWRRALETTTTNASRELGRPVAYEEAADAVLSAARRSLVAGG